MNKMLSLQVDQITLHPGHPAANLHPDICDRLVCEIDQYLSPDALVLISNIHPLIVVRQRNHFVLIANYHLWYYCRRHCITLPINCVCYNGLKHEKIKELGKIDLLLQSELAYIDEVARRVRAALHYNDLKECGHVSRRDLKKLKSQYALPIRKQNSLTRLLEDESEAVWSLIHGAPSPIGVRSKNNVDELKGFSSGSEEEISIHSSSPDPAD